VTDRPPPTPAKAAPRPLTKASEPLSARAVSPAHARPTRISLGEDDVAAPAKPSRISLGEEDSASPARPRKITLSDSEFGKY